MDIVEGAGARIVSWGQLFWRIIAEAGEACLSRYARQIRRAAQWKHRLFSVNKLIRLILLKPKQTRKI
jgi:hypothetical protein